jgi:hypothetical protein
MSTTRVTAGWVFLGLAIMAKAQGIKDQPKTTTNAAPNAFIGCWQSEGDKPFLLRCEPARVSWFDPEASTAQFFRARYDTGRVLFNAMGRWIPLPATTSGNTLVFAGKKTLRKVDKIPKELMVEPLRLGEIKEVPAEELKTIKEQLGQRFKEDQAVRDAGKGGAENWSKIDTKKMGAVDAGNTAYLLSIVSKYGWIDASRFGEDASQAAWFMVQHSGHLPLMLAVLPEIKKHLGTKARVTIAYGNAAVQGEVNQSEAYAMLYDRVMVMAGQKQRYGSQMGQNDKGQTLILALEDPKKVDHFRAEIGLEPILPGLESLEKQNPSQAIRIEEE